MTLGSRRRTARGQYVASGSFEIALRGGGPLRFNFSGPQVSSPLRYAYAVRRDNLRGVSALSVPRVAPSDHLGYLGVTADFVNSGYLSGFRYVSGAWNSTVIGLELYSGRVVLSVHKLS